MSDMMNVKRMIYHFELSAKIYDMIRSYRRDRLNHLSDEEFARRAYWKFRKKSLDLASPTSYDEKIWYLKLHEKDELKRRCTDKVTVREYVKECGLAHILNEVYGIYDSFSDIPFGSLPDTMFIKCSHTSGCNVIFRRNEFDYRYYRHEFGFWMKRDYYWGSREWNYRGIKPKVICERVLRDAKGRLPMDYKFFCFGGQVKFLSLDIGVAQETGQHSEAYERNLYDLDFHLLPIRETRENYRGSIEKPENFETMIEYAAILARPFRHCRVDLYNIDGSIYFGEITFHHGGGMNHFIPEEAETLLGSWIEL